MNIFQEKAKTHLASISQKKKKDLGWSVLNHPPYSPDFLDGLEQTSLNLSFFSERYLLNEYLFSLEEAKRFSY